MDIVQGGMFNVQSTIKTQFSDGLRSAKVKNQNWSMMDNHCFIPTVSALGFKNPSFHWNAAINTRNLVQTGEIPFDNYYIPSHNQDHVSLTKESVAWVMGQLNGNYYNQTGEFVITGPTTVCDQATFTINNLPPGATVQWSTSNNNLTLVSSEGNTATFGKNGNGECIIQCSIIVGATNFTITHSVWSGIPPIPIKILGLSKLAINSQYSFTVATNNLSPIDYFEWTLGGKKMLQKFLAGKGLKIFQ